MDADVINALKTHAAREYPRECCGLVVSVDGDRRYWPCRNTASDDGHFAIDLSDYAAAEDAGQVLAVCHSHPNASPEPSDADRTMCEVTGLPWIVVNHPVGTVAEFGPIGWEAPLVGRTFVHGVHDCYSLIRDYYARELKLELPDFEREERWWDKGQDLYRRFFAQAGFSAVETSALEPNDVILMRIRSEDPNHGAVYLGQNRMLQHMMDRLSERTIYGGWYRRKTTHVLRHRNFL